MILDDAHRRELAAVVAAGCVELRRNGIQPSGFVRDLLDVLALQPSPAVEDGQEWPKLDTGGHGTQPAFVDIREAAYRLSISERTARRRIADGLLPSEKLGRRRLIPTTALNRPGGTAC